MKIRIVPFARIREIVGAATLERVIPDGASAATPFSKALAREFPPLAELARSTRFVRGGAFVAADAELRDGDELGLLPPFGGG
jgi:molybdopterin converting factor small subunit